MRNEKKEKDNSNITVIYALFATVIGLAVTLLAYM